eukprot:GHVS01047882.1.p1 GENE.GHVS01047882.1~~GHVS01047882.1.p1  ORF type:complete len:437 (+),score=36.92 GHVS01047882.1:245-1555(+)
MDRETLPPSAPSEAFFRPKNLNKRNQNPYTTGSTYTIDKRVCMNYSLTGPSTGPLVVCLHGMSASLCQFTQLADKLNRYRFRVLRFGKYTNGQLLLCYYYCACCVTTAVVVLLHSVFFVLLLIVCVRGTTDFWGHGLSTRSPRGLPYAPETFADQLFDLMKYLGLSDAPFNLVGFSMGGLVAVYVANQTRFQISRVCLVSAAGLIKDKPRRINIMLGLASSVTIPLAKMAFLKCYIKRKHMEVLEQDGFYNPSKFSDDVEARYRRFRYKHRRNIETSLRVAKSMPFWENYGPYKKLAALHKPVCFLYGADDDISPPEEFASFLRQTFGPSNLLIYRECKHLVLIEQFDTASEDILYFLLGGQPGARGLPNQVSNSPQLPAFRSHGPIPSSSAAVPPPRKPEDRDAAYSVGTAGTKVVVVQAGTGGGGYGNVRAVRM